MSNPYKYFRWHDSVMPISKYCSVCGSNHHFTTQHDNVIKLHPTAAPNVDLSKMTVVEYDESCGCLWRKDGNILCSAHILVLRGHLKEKEMWEDKNQYVTKDSGQRQEFSTGMVRDIQTDKPRYDLLDMPMLKRWAELMARGAKKYGEENWRKAATEEELKRFKASFLRHAIQYFNGDTDEDHGSACFFNIAGAEMVKEKLKKEPLISTSDQPLRDIRQG